ncbi:hypothetical protein [Nocardia sp. NPDC003963]
MTTTTDPVIVPGMNRTGVALWTPTGPRIVHTEGDTSPGGSHTEGRSLPLLSHTEGDTDPVGPHTEGDTTPDPSHTHAVGTHTARDTDPAESHTPSHTPHVGTHTEGNTGTGETTTDQEVSPVGTDVGTHVGTPDDETRGTTPMYISDAHRTEVATLPTKAEQVRHICAILGNPETAEVHRWLEACEIEASRKYVSRIVNGWREENNLENTGEFQALTDADLAELTDSGDDDEPELENELADRVRRAQARIPLQDDPALYTALSDEEMDKERKLAEEEREAAREIRRRRMAAQLANAKRDQATAESIAKSEATDARWMERARSKKRRLTSEDAKLAQTVRNSEWSAWALVAAVALGMAWSAVNAQKGLVPDGNMADPLFWLSYGVEAMISLPLIIIMVASTSATRLGRAMKTEQKRKVIAVEVALLAATLTLNVGPHLTPAEGESINPIDLFKYGCAPVMVGVLLQVHAWVSDHYTDLIMHTGKAPSATESDEQPAEVH